MVDMWIISTSRLNSSLSGCPLHLLLSIYLCIALQIEKNNEPFLDSLIEYDDGRDLSDYDFKNDGFSFPYDDSNKRKLAYRHRSIAEKYSQVRIEHSFYVSVFPMRSNNVFLTTAMPMWVPNAQYLFLIAHLFNIFMSLFIYLWKVRIAQSFVHPTSSLNSFWPFKLTNPTTYVGLYPFQNFGSLYQFWHGTVFVSLRSNHAYIDY